jgi:hypothetical protein
MAHIIDNAREKLRNKLRKRRPRGRVAGETYAEIKGKWAKQWLQPDELSDSLFPNKARLYRWLQRWESARRSLKAIEEKPSKALIARHKGLRKAESSIIIQARSGRIGLAGFLHRARVPGYESPNCSCGQGQETPKHILIYCNKYRNVRRELFDNTRRLDFAKLLGTKAGYARASRWLIAYTNLAQFSLAKRLLYEEGTG